MSRIQFENNAFPPVVTSLIGACACMFLLQMRFPGTIYSPGDIETWLALWPLNGGLAPFYPWQLVTYAFLHGDFFHILVNMFALWMFGMQLENLWGSGKFAIYFFVCAVGAGILQLVVLSISGSSAMTLGASGGVLGVLLAFGRIYPNQMIMLLIPPVPMKAKWFVIIIGAFSLFAGMTGTQDNVAHFAHLGGMGFGFLLLLYWESKYGRGRF